MEQEPELPSASVLGKRREAPAAYTAPTGAARRRPRRRPAGAVAAPTTTVEQEREEQRQAEMDEEERLAALDLALSAIPAEVRQTLPIGDTRVLLESQVGLRLAETVAEVERLRADFARTDAERERLLGEVNRLNEELLDTQFANIEDDPRYRALQATRREALDLIEEQIRDSTLYQDLEREVVALREQLVAALQRAERAEAQAQAAQERFLRDTSQLQEAMTTIAATAPSAAGTDAMSVLGWQTFGLLALADLAEQAVTPEGAASATAPPYYYYMAPADAVFARFAAEAAQRASDYIENSRAAPVRQVLDQAAQVIDDIDAALATLSLDESQRQQYDEAAARTEETVAARTVQLRALQAAADVDRLDATYRTTMSQAYAFMRAASMLDDPAQAARIADALPVALVSDARSAPYLLAAALWDLRGRAGQSIAVPLAASNVIQAWTAARVMRALWWPLARAVLDPQATPDDLAALWTAVAAGPDQPVPDVDAAVASPEARTAFYNRLQAIFVQAFDPPTPESLLRVWRAADPARTVDGLARLLCGIVTLASGRLLRAPSDLILACQGLDTDPGAPAAVLDQMASLFGFGLPPWNSRQVSASAALLRPLGDVSPQTPKIAP
ncbi:SMC N incomplete domain containing protein [Pandoravirus salinus]|uniref:SMC N incomplete domain containing protein n=1 Tax=Pandoravirus salinus TaxID=1349410 RepID=S4VUN8_9VIRU|nr:SMC N superfamily incomplete domain [Pandoravirus salinus]AGO84058.1 SMC N incomplete domain containing protein [Pandoravirus salinus]